MVHVFCAYILTSEVEVDDFDRECASLGKRFVKRQLTYMYVCVHTLHMSV